MTEQQDMTKAKTRSVPSENGKSLQTMGAKSYGYRRRLNGDFRRDSQNIDNVFKIIEHGEMIISIHQLWEFSTSLCSAVTLNN